jgi:hypothetical protein
MICDYQDLAALDQKVAVLYEIVIEDRGVADSVRESQRSWLARRNSCSSRLCLKQRYQARMHVLLNIARKIRLRQVREWPQKCIEEPILDQVSYAVNDQIQYPAGRANVLREPSGNGKEYVRYTNCLARSSLRSGRECATTIYQRNGACYESVVSMDTDAGFEVLDAIPDYVAVPDQVESQVFGRHKILKSRSIELCSTRDGDIDKGVSEVTSVHAYLPSEGEYERIARLDYNYCDVITEE